MSLEDSEEASFPCLSTLAKDETKVTGRRARKKAWPRQRSEGSERAQLRKDSRQVI